MSILSTEPSPQPQTPYFTFSVLRIELMASYMLKEHALLLSSTPGLLSYVARWITQPWSQAVTLDLPWSISWSPLSKINNSQTSPAPMSYGSAPHKCLHFCSVFWSREIFALYWSQIMSCWLYFLSFVDNCWEQRMLLKQNCIARTWSEILSRP